MLIETNVLPLNQTDADTHSSQNQTFSLLCCANTLNAVARDVELAFKVDTNCSEAAIQIEALWKKNTVFFKCIYSSISCILELIIITVISNEIISVGPVMSRNEVKITASHRNKSLCGTASSQQLALEHW